MRLSVFHRTHYAYAVPVQSSFNEARLQPTDNLQQRRHRFLLKVLPPTRLSHYMDFYHNCVHMFDLSRPHTELTIEATSIVTTSNLIGLPEDSELAPFETLDACNELEHCYDYLQPSHFVNDNVEAWRLAIDVTTGVTDAWQAALKIMRFVNSEFAYQPASTHVHTTTQEAIKLRSGVCQDFAHVMIGMCRAIRIPARYVSGYLYNGPAEHLKGAQASHAWLEVYLPSVGWCGMDPTNNQQVNGHYIKIGVGRDYADVPPLKGTYLGTSERMMRVDVLVSLLDAKETVIPESASGADSAA
jgi:transglutaminase-like putative cysteine protease